MNILMMSNTYKPILGGLEKSVEAFSDAYRRKGHRVIIVAPEFEESLPEKDVIRMPSLQHFNNTEFSVKLPIPGMLTDALGEFKPDIVHAHHPFLIGATALRVAYKYHVPLVFTHHTLFEQNTHYVPGGDTEAMKRFVIELSTGYANLADHVFAPSGSLVELLRDRGVESPMDVVPTGIDLARFEGAAPDGRKEWNIPANAFVVGHVGRLAPEKNLEFLARAVAGYLSVTPDAYFLLAGKGPSEEAVRQIFFDKGVEDRLRVVGMVQDEKLIAAYRAMDVFAFASQSETQGLVLTEAMAGGVPIVAVDACGVRDVVDDKITGRLLPVEDEKGFAAALDWIKKRRPTEREAMRLAACRRAAEFSMEICAAKALGIYASLSWKEFMRRESDDSAWAKTMRRVKAEWDLVKTFTRATKDAVLKKEDNPIGTAH